MGGEKGGREGRGRPREFNYKSRSRRLAKTQHRVVMMV